MPELNDEKMTKYKDVLQRAMTSMVERMEALGEELPDAFCVDELPLQLQETVIGICAIQEEWIIDPVKRRELGMLTFDDDDDEL